MDAEKAEKLARLREMIDAVPKTGQALSGKAPMVKRPRSQRVSEDGETQPENEALPPAEKAYRRIVDLCGYHEFCTAKMRARLAREDLPADAIELAIQRAVRVGLIDDVRWGEMRASALMRKGKGSEGIIRELRESGIAANDIDGWPDAFVARYGDDFERAMNCLRKSPPRSKNPRASAYGKLVRKGYSASLAAQVSAAWFELHEEGIR